MSDIDKRLEEIAHDEGDSAILVRLRALASALLGARKREHEIHSYADGRQITAISVKDREAWRDIERMTRGKDAELEELLR